MITISIVVPRHRMIESKQNLPAETIERMCKAAQKRCETPDSAETRAKRNASLKGNTNKTGKKGASKKFLESMQQRKQYGIIPVIFEGKQYDSITDCIRITGRSNKYLQKHITKVFDDATPIVPWNKGKVGYKNPMNSVNMKFYYLVKKINKTDILAVDELKKLIINSEMSDATKAKFLKQLG